MTSTERDVLALQSALQYVEKGQLVTVTFGGADTTFYVAHKLKANPYYLVLRQDRAGSVYAAPLDEQKVGQLALRCSTASLCATLLLWEVPS